VLVTWENWLVRSGVRPDLADEIFIDLNPDTGLEGGRSRWKSQLVQAHYLRATVETLCSKLASIISDQNWHD